MTEQFIVRNAHSEELSSIGELLVNVYAALDGFPKPSQQPAYYEMLKNVGDQLNKPLTEILVCVDRNGLLAGAVVFFGDMQYYGSGGTATNEKAASGFRLLAVDPIARGKGIGKLLTVACIEKARSMHSKQLIIHTTKSMQTAWRMYEALGFKRSEDLDFMQGELQVFGFRLGL